MTMVTLIRVYRRLKGHVMPFRKRTVFALATVATPLLLFAVLNALAPLPTERLHPPPSTLVVDRRGEVLRAFLAADDMWRFQITKDEIPHALKKAVLAFEDRYFYWHPGINPVAVCRAAAANIRSGKIVQGASTITMQLARMMQPRERTFRSKIIEAFRALQLEWCYSKDEILTFYLNLAPYGGNLVGVATASQFYFNKRPDQLSLGESALLAAIPNSPNRYRPDLNGTEARHIRNRILHQMHARGVISVAEHDEARSEPLPRQRFEPRFTAPQLSENLIRGQQATSSRIQTTIDLVLQQQTVRILQTHMKPLQAHGVHNAAVVIIDNAAREVLAYVGSHDFFDAAHQGQVDGAGSPRSPGSALKPFIYALGVEHGLISPKSLLADVPVAYADYRPQNYDDTFHGAVTMQEALIRSMNVPAVNLYAQLGDRGIYSFMKAAGITTLTKPKEHYGLSLILGGGEVTLLELTNLYAGLAQYGLFRPAKLLLKQQGPLATRLLSPGSSFIIIDILSRLRRPELPAVWDAARDIPKVAWKTGTSYGHKDAWSIGFTPELTIGVWVGNFDGAGAPALVGAESAAPILFALFEAFSDRLHAPWFTAPETVQRRQVCAISGMLPTPYCAMVQNEAFLPGISPSARCTIHRKILIDQQTGLRLCGHCRIGRTYREQIYEVWPAEIAAWKQKHGLPLPRLPEHFPACDRVATGAGPVIQSPPADSEYKIRSGVALKFQKILLRAAVSNQTRRVYWFLNDKLLHTGSPDEKVYLTPHKGRHTIMCMDDEGRASQVNIKIN